MPSSDYASTVKGGLKLKGGAKDARVKKKKKSSSSKKDESAQTQGGESSAATGLEEKRDPAREDEESGAGALERNGSDGEDGDEASKTVERRSSSERALTPAMGTGKTETQLRHEEIRRKRVSVWTSSYVLYAFDL